MSALIDAQTALALIAKNGMFDGRRQFGPWALFIESVLDNTVGFKNEDGTRKVIVWNTTLDGMFEGIAKLRWEEKGLTEKKWDYLKIKFDAEFDKKWAPNPDLIIQNGRDPLIYAVEKKNAFKAGSDLDSIIKPAIIKGLD
jgi:hypothetical protein